MGLKLYEVANEYLHDLELLEHMETSGELSAQVAAVLNKLEYHPVTGLFVWKQTNLKGKIAGTLRKNGYRIITIDRKGYRAHRLAWFIVNGKFPLFDIDHINGNRDDNRISNLREATRSQNMENLRAAKSNNTSCFLGVSYMKRDGRYMSRIKVYGKQIFLGYFNTAEEAHMIYVEKKRKIHNFCVI